MSEEPGWSLTHDMADAVIDELIADTLLDQQRLNENCREKIAKLESVRSALHAKIDARDQAS
jgi:hypothetical protein